MAILKLNKLNKHYPLFDLKDVSFELNGGRIMGFIGRNGAGKTTTLKAIMNIISLDSGEIEMFGKDFFSNIDECKSEVGFVMSGHDFFPNKKLKAIRKTYSRFYPKWSDEKYFEYIKHFKLDENKKLNELSQGMKVKFLLALALSHDAKLLILDEPTSGLDPISREELLEIFLNIIKNKERAILFSTHITSDLDKVADDITYIRDGEIVISEDKSKFIASYKLVEAYVGKIKEDELASLISYRNNKGKITGLIEASKESEITSKDVAVKEACIDDIIVFLEKEKEQYEEFAL